MAVDSRKIIEVASTLQITSNERGIMGAFGIYALMNYNEFYFKLVTRMTGKMDDTEAQLIERNLYDAVLECGYHTLHGVRTSMHWREHVLPMIDSPEDEVYALVAFTNIFGIGYIEVVELEPGEKLVTTVKNSYDAKRYLQEYGLQRRGRCYMFNGCTASYMDLVYGPRYPAGMGTFISEEKICRSTGHACCRFVARRHRKQPESES
jgi:hypothetical protein